MELDPKYCYVIVKVGKILQVKKLKERWCDK
jgi:hypothetical protein